MHLTSRILPAVFTFFCVCCHSHAQPAVGDSESVAPVTISQDMPVDQLSLVLKPMTREELAGEATAWRDRLKQKATQIAAVEVAVRRLHQDAEANGEKTDTVKKKSEMMGQVNRLREEQAVLLGQFKTVLDAYELKGGDVAEYRQYAAALGGITVDATDAVGTWMAATGWLTSKEGGVKWLIYIAQFTGIMIAFWFISRLIGGLVRKALSGGHLRLSGLMKRFINNMVRRVILLIGLLIALSTIGVNVGALVALIGGGAFVVGFALQDTLSNFANGMMVLIYRPFDVGDAVDVGGVAGTVDAVSLVNTTIRSWDNQLILVPNKEVWGKVITNITGSSERRVDMVFGIGYADDSDKAKAILERIVREHEHVLAEPAPAIRLHELADSSVNFIVRPWTKTANYWSVYWDLTERVKKAFDAEGISIPFPQRDVHVYQHALPAKSPVRPVAEAPSEPVSQAGIDSDDER
ncbi:MAG: mechanosensitive ion channel family protein [Prosthecobacter sp.]